MSLPACSGWVRGKLPHTAESGSTTGMFHASAKAVRASNPPASRPEVSVTITGLAASRIICATGSTSSGELCVEPGGTMGLASRPSQSSSRISSGMLRYAGPAGARQASSAARVIIVGRVWTLPTSFDHLVNGWAMPCGPPTIDRLRYHWPPGSWPGPSPYVVDSEEATTIGTPHEQRAVHRHRALQQAGGRVQQHALRAAGDQAVAGGHADGHRLVGEVQVRRRGLAVAVAAGQRLPHRGPFGARRAEDVVGADGVEGGYDGITAVGA